MDGSSPVSVPEMKGSPNWRQTLHAFRTNPIKLWPEAAYHEPIVCLDLVTRPVLVVSDPDLIRHVLIANPDNYRRTATAIRLVRPLVGRGLLLSQGKLWRRQRRIVAASLAPRSLPTLMKSTAGAIGAWLETLRTATDSPIDLLSAFQVLALDIATRSMFSMTAAPFTAEMRALLNGPTADLWQPDAFDLMFPAWLPSPRDVLRWRLKRRWTGLIRRIIAARTARPPPDEPQDLLDLLRAASAEDGATGVRQLRDEVGTLLVAGHETTALALFWSCVLLAGDRPGQERIAAETSQLNLAGTGAEISTVLDQMTYTRAVVSEALRLYPPAAIIARQAIDTERYDDRTITRGTRILIAPWVLHRHHAFWSNPDEYDPARFLPGAPPIARFAYLPFGAGPRVCVGAQFAMAEATLSLAALIRDYAITRADSRPIEPVVILTTRPDHAPQFHLALRAPPGSGLTSTGNCD